MFESARDGILILDSDTGRITDVNPFLIELLGFSHDEMVGKTIGELSPFKDTVSNQAMMERLQKDGFVRYEDLPLETKDGRHIAVEFVSNVYQAGDVKVIQCNIRDISERVRAEVERREGERFNQATLDALSAHVAVLDEQGNILAANKAWREFARANATDWKLDSEGMNYLTVCEQAAAQGDQNAAQTIKGIRAVASGAQSPWTHEYPCHSPTEQRWFICRVTRFPGYGPVRVVVAYENITERKCTESALQEEQARFNSLMTTIPDMIYFKDRQSRFVRINDAMARRFGLQHGADAVGRTDFDFYGTEHALQAYEDEQHVMRTGEPLIAREEKENWPDGRYTWASSTKVAVSDSQGNITGLVGVSRNVTDVKKIEARFRRLVDSNAQGVIFWNTKGQITEANDSFLELVGYTRADLAAGQIDWMAMTPPEYAALDQHALQEIAAKGVCIPYEKEFIRMDGSRVPILIGAATFEDTSDEGVCFVLDLTERKKIESQFRQSQKMEAIGTLAGGVAHDFNNILAVIQMQTGLLQSIGGLSAEQVELTDGIGNAVQKAADLTRQLLLFSRKKALQLRDLDLTASVREMTKLLKRTLGENIVVQLKLATQPMLLYADAGMISQVLLNLAVNARDAMPDGGQLVIETDEVKLDEFAATQTAQARPGSFVRLSVSDTGCGIPAKNLSKIFEPFFTTKDVGKGTGLGLATVFGIAQQHHGWVNVYSEVGRGTTFKVYLPQLAESHNTEIIKNLLATVQTGHETILLVEDDSALRAMIEKTLTGLGYRVLEASTGFNALEVWKEHASEIHLLLTDLMMPDGMTGKELGQQLLQENPKLKVVYMSGYSAEIVAKDFPLQEGVNFLIKPFQTQHLSQTIRQHLDAPRVGT